MVAATNSTGTVSVRSALLSIAPTCDCPPQGAMATTPSAQDPAGLRSAARRSHPWNTHECNPVRVDPTMQEMLRVAAPPSQGRDGRKLIGRPKASADFSGSSGPGRSSRWSMATTT